MDDKLEAEKTLTIKEAYEAMIYMLLGYNELTDSTDLTDILSGGEYATNGKPADPVFWEYWLEAIERLKKEGPKYKRFIKK